MSGLKSRNKGKREEYALRDALRQNLGMTVDRIPASGAAQGFKGDLRVKYREKEYTLELKSRKKAFARLYQWLDDVGACDMYYTDELGQLTRVSISKAMHHLPPMLMRQEVSYNHTPTPQILAQLKTVRKMKGMSNVLVLKSNNQPYIFLAFVPVLNDPRVPQAIAPTPGESRLPE